MSKSGSVWERNFSIKQHVTVQTMIFLVHSSLHYITKQTPLKRYTVLIVYQPCTRAQSISVFVVRRMRNQAAFRKAILCILHWFLNPQCFLVFFFRWVDNLSLYSILIKVSENKGAVWNTNLHIQDVRSCRRRGSPFLQMQWAGTQRLVIFHSPLTWRITMSFSTIQIYELLFDSSF